MSQLYPKVSIYFFTLIPIKKTGIVGEFTNNVFSNGKWLEQMQFKFRREKCHEHGFVEPAGANKTANRDR
jgi:hypothetical protein